MKHIWIIKKDSSTMLFYHSFDNAPFRAIIVSGLLAALNNFSEVEIQEQGIQSIEMHDMRWTYVISSKHNLLLIAADAKEQNSKVMRSQLEIVLKLFVIKYHIDLKYWEDGAANLQFFEKFKITLRSLRKEWELVSESRTIGTLLDMLGLFQQILIKYIKIIRTYFKKKAYLHILREINEYTPLFWEWDEYRVNPEAFKILKLYIPMVDLTKGIIIFDTSSGDSLVNKETLGLEPTYMKSFFYSIIRHYNETIKEYVNEKTWYDIQCREFLPILFSRWDQLQQLGILKELTRLLLTYNKESEK
ncbi:hypothetical protein DSAG12_02545 [Promethearchaeum syntrophicum]|uniref:FUZ/MON1/HPS1 first Longin domain-containing protein n=1 Tax=Promethearchaeum syntrophicum TaxID=2594042 RepID=A0A5B9DCH3_9ARCH|nr:hypothetical protein [Candidatus Prometheoarchaeum syntrophicum]QEE16715.1 hypothetical protein DSAG12_02545 [Candidatus Prometheoarchaeum syntrophicum]